MAGLLCAAVAPSACGGALNAVSSEKPFQTAARQSTSSYPITHIVLVIQENRTFNDLFATFPGALGATSGLELVGKGKKAKQVSIKLTEADLGPTTDLVHTYIAYQTAYDKGNMDDF